MRQSLHLFFARDWGGVGTTIRTEQVLQSFRGVDLNGCVAQINVRSDTTRRVRPRADGGLYEQHDSRSPARNLKRVLQCERQCAAAALAMRS